LRLGGELLGVVFGVRTQGVKGALLLGVTRLAALMPEVLDVIGVFKIAVALVAAGMGRDEIARVGEAEAAPSRLSWTARSEIFLHDCLGNTLHMAIPPTSRNTLDTRKYGSDPGPGN
jgi:hypothetical protein